MAKAKVQYNAVGRRKSSVARVYLTAGTGEIVINGKTNGVCNKPASACTFYFRVVIEVVYDIRFELTAPLS